MEAARYYGSMEIVQYSMNPLTHIRTISGRELDHPRYDGRYDKPTNNSDHSIDSDDLQSINHVYRGGNARRSAYYDPQRLQQEPQLTDLACQGCYEHPANYDYMD